MQHLDLKAIWLFFTKNLLSAIIIMPLWYIAVYGLNILLLPNIGKVKTEEIVSFLNFAGLICLILIIIFSYLAALFSYYFFRYELRADGFRLERGVILRKHTTIEYDHIQNVELYINPIIVRLLGMYAITITIVSSHSNDENQSRTTKETISGLSIEDAQQLRDELIKLSHVQPARRNFTPT